MYLGILLYTLPLVIFEFSLWLAACEFLLVADLGVKIAIEEKLLQERFTAYEGYKKKTWRLIPFVF